LTTKRPGPSVPVVENLLSNVPQDLPAERFDFLVDSGAVRIERIISTGQVTPDGTWYDQSQAEWVVLLTGAAEIDFEGEATPRRLGPGDHLLIPPHCRHRVSWTAEGVATVWLAVHFDPVPTAAASEDNLSKNAVKHAHGGEKEEQCERLA